MTFLPVIRQCDQEQKALSPRVGFGRQLLSGAAMRHLLSWALQFGLDYFNANAAVAVDQQYWPQFAWYNRWAGKIKSAAHTPGALLLLHGGLDASDTTRFPVAEYGAADVTNVQQFQKIARYFSSFGAGLDDPKGAANADQSKQEKATGINDVGWRIWATNYGA